MKWNHEIVTIDCGILMNEDSKYLGIVFDGIRFVDVSHVSSCSKLSAQLFLAGSQNSFLVRLAYTSLINFIIRYGFVLWGSKSRKHFLRVFRSPSRVIRITSGVVDLNTPIIYIYEILLFYRFKSWTIQTGTYSR